MAYQSSTSRTRKRPQHRRKARGRTHRSSTALPLLQIACAVLAVGTLAGVGYIAVKDMNTAKPDALGCYAQPGGSSSTTVFVDSSDPGFDPVQSRDLSRAFTNIFKRELIFNERFSLITTQESRIGTIPAPVIELCGTAKSPHDLKEIGAASITQAFLERQSEQAFEKQVKPVLDEAFSVNPSAANRQRRESPILEQIQNLARNEKFLGGQGQQKAIFVSDLIQNTSELQFCSTQGHLPKFEKFKQQPLYDRLKPPSLTGVDVTVYMLIRGELGRPPYSYCTEEELTKWWRDYFAEAGAQNVTFIRIRQGG